MESYLDRFDEILFAALFFIHSLVTTVFIATMFQLKITIPLVLIIFFSLIIIFSRYWHIDNKSFDRSSRYIIAILVISLLFYSYLLKYFKVILWDGAGYLLSAQMLLTLKPIIYEFYKPFTWPAFLSIGMLVNSKEAISVLNIVMLVASVYLFSLTLTKNKQSSLLSALFSVFTPVLLIWGLSYYLDAYLTSLVTLGFASYFHYLNTDKKNFYIASVFLFSLASLTKFNFLLALLVPFIEMFRKKLWFSSSIPVLIIYLPYFIFEYIKTQNPLYGFVQQIHSFNEYFNYNVYPNSYYLFSMDSLFSWPLFALFLIGMCFLILEKNKKLVMLGLVFGLELFYFIVISHVKDTRYLIFLVPLITASSAYVLIKIKSHFKKQKQKIVFICYTATVLFFLINNYNYNIKIQYRYTGNDVLNEAASFLEGKNGNIMTNSNVRLSWYLGRPVLTMPQLDKAPEFIKQENVRYIVILGYSDSQDEYRNNTEFFKFGKLVKHIPDRYESINIIEVKG